MNSDPCVSAPNEHLSWFWVQEVPFPTNNWVCSSSLVLRSFGAVTCFFRRKAEGLRLLQPATGSFLSLKGYLVVMRNFQALSLKKLNCSFDLKLMIFLLTFLEVKVKK